MNYAVLSLENEVLNVLLFEDSFTNFDAFSVSEKVVHNQEVTLLKVEGTNTQCAIGFIYDGKDFKPKKPYPSWVWDSDKWIWRPPAFHPEGWPELSRDLEYGSFIWSEEAQEWISK